MVLLISAQLSLSDTGAVENKKLFTHSLSWPSPSKESIPLLFQAFPWQQMDNTITEPPLCCMEMEEGREEDRW